MSKNLTEFFVDLIYEIQKSIRNHLARNWQSFLNLFMPTTFMKNKKAHQHNQSLAQSNLPLDISTKKDHI
ncbi:hypothetical protein LHK_01117 [Laribacter hongkongensis HLHK9]|uniref:Uncharacterized protein n=1 Tax=Laribacter hongkongensis (strain HLHK9) TaxID=557598 RepID=C1D6K2_LARHH|nr:hypothetical protein LHK_01117 [Laribacter hongkongensis HLHK9]